MPNQPTGLLLEPRRGLIRVERKAWRCLEKCRKKLGLQVIPLPVPVEDCIERALDIRFGVADLSRLGEDVLGAAFVKDREILIAEEALKHEGRFRFTCAHELGHVILHRRVKKVFHETVEPGSETRNRFERQADQFAASFLMPIRPLERELYRICHEGQLDPLHCLKELMVPTLESEWLWKKKFLPALTRTFAVSVSAALIRFRDLRLIVAANRSLLPASLKERLLRPALSAEDLSEIRIFAGRPKRSRPAPTLFDANL